MREVDQELFDAVEQGNLGRVKRCINRGASVCAVKNYAVQLTGTALRDFMVGFGISAADGLSVTGGYSKTPLDVAREKGHKEIAAYLAIKMADLFHEKGKYNKAWQAYQEAFGIQEVILGPSHPGTLSTRHNIAVMLKRQGKYSEALGIYREVFEKRRDVLGPDHPDTLRTRHNMAGVFSEQGKYSKALEIYREVFEKRRDVLGPNRPDTLRTRHNMAGVFSEQGKYSKALEIYREVFDVQQRRDVLGPDHPDTLRTRHNTAGVFSEQGKYSKALEIYREVFEKRRDVLGPDHPDTLRTRHNMAGVFSEQGEYSKALEIYREVFEKRRGVLGPDHPDTLRTYHNMAEVFSEQGKYGKALEIYREVFDVQQRRDVLGPDHPDTLRTRHNMVGVLDDQGEYSKALEIYQEVFDVQRRRDVLGPDHPDTLRTLHNMAGVFSEQGECSRALEIYREVFDVQRRRDVLGPDHPDTLRTRHNMAGVFSEQGECSKALEIYWEVFDVQQRGDVLGPDHPDTLRTRHNMAGVFSEQGEYSRALEIYREVFEKRRDVLGPDHPDTLRTRHNMAGVFFEQGKHGKALEIYREVLEKRRDVLGHDHPDTLRTRHNMAGVLSEQGEYGKALKTYREVFEKRMNVLGHDHPDTLLTSRKIEVVREKMDTESPRESQGRESKRSIQFCQEQREAYLHLSRFVSRNAQDASIVSVKQGLCLPFFDTRNVEASGRCTAITRGLSQALLSQGSGSFLSSLKASDEICKRIAQGRQVSKREEREVFAFGKLLNKFDGQLDSSTNSLPLSLICTQSYETLGDLSSRIAEVRGSFAIHLVIRDHVVAIYRIGNSYAYFDSNAAFISGLKSVDQLVDVVEKGIKSAGYKIEEKGFLVEHFDIAKANSQLSNEDKRVLAKEIKTERQLLAEQDEVLGLIKVNGQEISRVQLYDFGTKIHVEGGVPALINASMTLSSKKFQDHLGKKEISMTAREYLGTLEGSKSVEEVVQAAGTGVIPFEGSSSEIRGPEKTHKAYNRPGPYLSDVTVSNLQQEIRVLGSADEKYEGGGRISSLTRRI